MARTPAGRQRKGRSERNSQVREAAQQLLSEAQVREGLRLEQVDLDTLRALSSPRPPRNAATILAALKLRLDFSQPRPRQDVGLGGPNGEPLQVSVVINRTVAP